MLFNSELSGSQLVRTRQIVQYLAAGPTTRLRSHRCTCGRLRKGGHRQGGAYSPVQSFIVMVSSYMSPNACRCSLVDAAMTFACARIASTTEVTSQELHVRKRFRA